MTTRANREASRAMTLAAHIAHSRARALQSALSEATASHWARRADAFEAARPRPGDFTGRASPADVAAQDRRLAAMALACRRHADLAPLDDAAELVADALQEVA